MGLMVIFALVVIVAAFGVVRSLRSKNLLGLLFALGTVVVFGWFTFMTLFKDGFPTAH
ncbi:DUF2759 domain-containing protein [Fredinandcohnia quinoae]|uniref:DUF2759 domain-containing protein n=1 Tax=Fredinandcohnia quinoae TaxID=2918902 RepID=A0AAW5DX46_9BACI|nr:DUF2759 domain-containing protein [Fredinandcohnia sp. SECRCQ15]MCH1624923.1 DUF2759 domain-containing protein [Fredinandcohnia sp. SECRCQ15]